MWQAAGTGARGDPEPHAVGRGVQSRGTARASQSPLPVFIDSIVDRRSMRSASALSRARAETWSCRGAADPCLRAGTFQPQAREGPGQRPVLRCHRAGTQPTEPAPATHE